MLLKAGGANYSVQEENKGNFGDYKKVTHQFYQQKDKETALKKVVYAEGPLTTTPCDISGISMVASQSEFFKNTSNVFRGKNEPMWINKGFSGFSFLHDSTNRPLNILLLEIKEM